MKNTPSILGTYFAFAAVLAATIGCGSGGGSPGIELQGAGASFPAPLYTSWFKEYSKAHKGVQIDYQSVGSGSGVTAVIDGTVDFGASDAAMKEEEMAKVERGVQLLPMTAGAIVLAYNLDGVDELKLSREAYVDIFLGKIKKWNDPKIAATNEGVSLPDQEINVVVRSDSSGTTYVFTQHLSTISPEFAESPGTNKAPNWPVGTKSKGNEGVTTSLAQNPGSIGYVEFGYAMKAKLAMVSLENKSGEFIKPSIASAQAALAGVEMPENLIAWLPDPEGKDSYPIVTYTWIIAYKKYDSEEKVKVFKDLIQYCLTEGQNSSESLGYIPLPESVVAKVSAALDNISAGK
ncbi:phosphate ABC transporter substrate-binding protein PstS [Bremerella cremea]|uniref:Phosphate-binding protein n=1 Tax=Blastopirellula marina TaxID=124 RepID=A0A2S8G8B2_9BACT|nr:MULTISPECIES: phosphate ABC transporter substrate-binding protein PstS [Pirellulaceae]PQO40540.1 phosphate ABC transporter substrate-binding protein PstS [Blastopirellula marina]RCS52122.1 phosphate ABC transporter substrate-binding protein PstS [Bremerella cremea]